MIGLQGLSLPQAVLSRMGSVGGWLTSVGVHPAWTSGSLRIATTLRIGLLLAIALPLPNTLEMLASVEPALGVKPTKTRSRLLVALTCTPNRLWALAWLAAHWPASCRWVNSASSCTGNSDGRSSVFSANLGYQPDWPRVCGGRGQSADRSIRSVWNTAHRRSERAQARRKKPYSSSKDLSGGSGSSGHSADRLFLNAYGDRCSRLAMAGCDASCVQLRHPRCLGSTCLHTLQEAIAVGGLKNAIVFLDFQNFLMPEQNALEPGDDARRFRTLPDGSPNPHRRLQIMNDMFLSLATMGALTDSVSTIAGQQDPGLLDLAPNGSATEAEFINASRADGMHDLFAQKDAFEAERAKRLRPIIAGQGGHLPNLDLVRQIMTLAQAHHVTLTLVIVPHHADALELSWRNGLWPRIEQLKTELAAAVAEQETDVKLWDFLDYSSFTTEPVPPAGDRLTLTHWFWEPSHFKKQLGAVMIQRMFADGGPAFGVRLQPDVVADRNALIRADRQRFVCEQENGPFLVALAEPIPDQCTVEGRAANSL